MPIRVLPGGRRIDAHPFKNRFACSCRAAVVDYEPDHPDIPSIGCYLLIAP